MENMPSLAHRAIFLTLIVCAVLMQSCTAYKKLPYLQEVDTLTPEQLATTAGGYDTKIKPNDVLSIAVSSTIQGAVVDFSLSNNSAPATGIVQGNPPNNTATSNYLVDKEGNINFPVLGTLKVAEMTTEEVTRIITDLIYPKYISQKPIVTINIQNFKVTVLGEVNSPGIYNAENGKMTIFDALASAGDLSIYGKRNNVLLIRTKDDGELITYRIDLQDKGLLLDKNLYYLQQNDKLYVEANKAQGNNSAFGRVESLAISSLSLLISIIAIVTR